MDNYLEDDDDSEDEYEECGAQVYDGDDLVGYCVKWAGHLGQCAHIIILK
jgi:hypothetical protein